MPELWLYCDGGSRANPGAAGIGVSGILVEGNKKTCILEKSDYLKDKSNNYAEYTALIRALDYAIEMNYNIVVVHSDSKLIIEQLSGNWNVKSVDLLELYKAARIRMAKLKKLGVNLTLKWVPREQNKHADSLANLAMDRGMKPEVIALDRRSEVDQRLLEALLAHEEAIKDLKEVPRVSKITRVEETFETLVNAWAVLKN